METTTAADNRAAYLSVRAAWKQSARDKTNTAQDFIRYIITQSLYLAERLGEEASRAWALRKLREGFTPHSIRGRASLQSGLASEARSGGFYKVETAKEIASIYQSRATYLHDEIRLEG